MEQVLITRMRTCKFFLATITLD